LFLVPNWSTIRFRNEIVPDRTLNSIYSKISKLKRIEFKKLGVSAEKRLNRRKNENESEKEKEVDPSMMLDEIESTDGRRL